MAKNNFTENTPATQETKSTIEFILPDGPHYNTEAGEWEIWLNGDPVAWARNETKAWRSYHELVDYDYEYRRSILVNECGATASIIVDWWNCPTCGGSVDNGKQCQRCSQPELVDDWYIVHSVSGTIRVSRGGKVRYD